MYIEVYIEHNTIQLNRTFTYRCHFPVYEGCRVKVPFGPKDLIGFVDRVDVQTNLKNVRDVLEVLDEKPLLSKELMELARYISDRYVCSIISVLKTMLPPALRPSSSHAKIVYEDWIVLKDESLARTVRQKEDYNKIKKLIPVKASICRKQVPLTSKLIQLGCIGIEKRVKETHEEFTKIEDTSFDLTQEQSDAIDKIQNSSSPIFLLHGVTGSGKTEIFLQLANNVLEQGKQVLFLVPEIGLTPMMIQRVEARFRTTIAIYHSALSATQKYEQYLKVKEKKAKIVIATRSGVFLPFSDLGLILMDEEHDNSYKQDSMPRYHARDVVLWRSKYHKCKVVLASATPSLDSYARAYKGRYELVELRKRVYQNMPEIHMVDLKHSKTENGFSLELIEAMRQSLERKEQVILLLNRRGYLPIVKCADCNEVYRCPDCGLSLAYHKDKDVLMCHCCGRVFPFQHKCQKCGSNNFFRLNMGTQSLEERVKCLFPYANVYRMDADSTQKKNSHSKILDNFKVNGDILIGTQMVAKGLDFERVTVVGILQADNALAHTDYYSSELAYSLLEQASGRCGRKDKPGHVYIQTFEPDHYVMRSVFHHDYLSFFKTEMGYRHMGQYAPYTYMCTILYVHPEEERAIETAKDAARFLSDLKVLGPMTISMRRRKQRVRLVVKCKEEELLRKRIWDLVYYHLKLKTSVKQEINMYPLGLEE